MFASCDNDNTTNPEPQGTVTIKGAIVANLDEDEDVDNLEKIPSGVSVYFLGDDGSLLGSTLTTSDGYTMDLPIGAPRTITIAVGDFETTIHVYDFVEDDFVNKSALYNERESVDIDAVKGATYIQNIEISQPTPLDF